MKVTVLRRELGVSILHANTSGKSTKGPWKKKQGEGWGP